MAKGRNRATKAKPKKAAAKKTAVKKPEPKVAAKPAAPHKYSVRATAGRPPHFETPEDLQEAVDAYFIYCEGEYHTEKKPVVKKKATTDEEDGDGMEEVKVWDRYPEPLTVTGLVLFLGFAHRQSLDDYEGRDEYSDIIKRARSRVENAYEKKLYHDRPAGAIFALTNMGWKNQQNFDHTTKGDKIAPSGDMSRLSDDDLLKLAEIQKKACGE